MFQLFSKFLISFLITNWIYSEVVLFVPSLENFVVSLYRTLQIPTHDKWPEIAKSSHALALEKDLYKSVRGVDTWLNPFSSLFDRGVRVLWHNKHSVQSEGPLVQAFGDKGSLPFESGERIFTRVGSYF